MFSWQRPRSPAAGVVETHGTHAQLRLSRRSKPPSSILWPFLCIAPSAPEFCLKILLASVFPRSAVSPQPNGTVFWSTFLPLRGGSNRPQRAGRTSSVFESRSDSNSHANPLCGLKVSGFFYPSRVLLPWGLFSICLCSDLKMHLGGKGLHVPQ